MVDPKASRFWQAAQQSGLPARNYSFTRAARIVQSFAPKISSARSPQEAQQHFASEATHFVTVNWRRRSSKAWLMRR